MVTTWISRRNRAEIPEELLDADHRSGYGLSSEHSEHGDEHRSRKGKVRPTRVNTYPHHSTSISIQQLNQRIYVSFRLSIFLYQSNLTKSDLSYRYLLIQTSEQAKRHTHPAVLEARTHRSIMQIPLIRQESWICQEPGRSVSAVDHGHEFWLLQWQSCGADAASSPAAWLFRSPFPCRSSRDSTWGYDM